MPLQLYKIASVEVGSAGASTIDFTSIPSGYTDIQLVFSARSSAGLDTPYVQFNGDTAANYTGKRLFGNGSTATSDNWTAAANSALMVGIPGTSYTSNTFSNHTIYIPNYAGSTAKSVSGDGTMENNATSSDAGITASLWSGTAAINRVTLKLYSSSNFVQYTSATLYGIL